jgi:hypothetical protein
MEYHFDVSLTVIDKIEKYPWCRPRGAAARVACAPPRAQVRLTLWEPSRRCHATGLHRARAHIPYAQPQPERALQQGPTLPRRVPPASPARPLMRTSLLWIQMTLLRWTFKEQSLELVPDN